MLMSPGLYIVQPLISWLTLMDHHIYSTWESPDPRLHLGVVASVPVSLCATGCIVTDTIGFFFLTFRPTYKWLWNYYSHVNLTKHKFKKCKKKQRKQIYGTHWRDTKWRKLHNINFLHILTSYKLTTSGILHILWEFILNISKVR